MAKQNAGGTVEERDVDVDLIERDLTSQVDNEIALVGGKTRGVGRGEFLMAAKTYQPKIKEVELPAPFEGRAIKVKELNAGERDHYESKLVKGKLGKQVVDMTELRIGLIIAAAVDWDDEITPLFTEKDRDYLKKMGISVIQKIYDVASELSAVSKEDEDELLGE